MDVIALKSWQNVTKCMADGGNAEEDYNYGLCEGKETLSTYM